MTSEELLDQISELRATVARLERHASYSYKDEVRLARMALEMRAMRDVFVGTPDEQLTKLQALSQQERRHAIASQPEAAMSLLRGLPLDQRESLLSDFPTERQRLARAALIPDHELRRFVFVGSRPGSAWSRRPFRVEGVTYRGVELSALDVGNRLQLIRPVAGKLAEVTTEDWSSGRRVVETGWQWSPNGWSTFEAVRFAMDDLDFLLAVDRELSQAIATGQLTISNCSLDECRAIAAEVTP